MIFNLGFVVIVLLMSTRPQNENYSDAIKELYRKPFRKAKRPAREVFIDNPAELAALFAKVVTTSSDKQDDWVARNGEKSIFSALNNILPEVIFTSQ